MKLHRQSAVLLALAAVGLVFGCSSGSGKSSSSKAVAPVTSKTTSPVTSGTAPVTTGVAPITTLAPPVVVNTVSRYLYSANYTDDVTPFTIDAKTGDLKAGTPVKSAAGTWAIASHPSGKFLYALGTSDVASFAIDDKTGNITAIGGQTITISGSTRIILCDPTGAFVIVTTDTTVFSLKVNPTTGVLTNASSLSIPGGPRDVAFDPKGKFVYVTGYSAGNVSCVLLEAGTGKLSVASSILAGAGARPICMDPAGKFVFVGSVTAKDVQAFSRDAVTGALTAAGSAKVTGSAYGVQTDPTGKFLYVACDEDTTSGSPSCLNQFSIDAAGKLTPLTPATAAGGDWPIGLSIDNSGQYAYCPNFGFGAGADCVQAFTLDPKTGLATAHATPALAGTGASPHGIAIVK